MFMQRRHSIRHLAWRGGVAAVSHAMMFSGLYPLLPHARRAYQRKNVGTIRTALAEWGMAMAVSGLRPAGFLPLPGARRQGPRPVIVIQHEAIPGLMEEAMAMPFLVASTALFEGLKNGDRIAFTLRDVPDALLVIAIERLPPPR